MKKKRKWFPGIRRYDVLTDANVDNEQQQREGTSNVSSDQSSASSSSEILLPAPRHSFCYVKQTRGRLICDSIERKKDTKAYKGVNTFCF